MFALQGRGLAVVAALLLAAVLALFGGRVGEPAEERPAVTSTTDGPAGAVAPRRP
jgi:hypothetical protein